MSITPKKENPNILFEALKRGDEDAFERLYATYYEKLCAYLLSYTGDKEKVEDTVQETFMALWSKQHELKIRVSLKSYLYRSAHNKLMDKFREQQKSNSLLSDYYHTALMRAANIDDDYRSVQLKKLKECMEQLPPRCLEVFTANKIAGKKYKQVASELNLSLKTVEGHVSKAYKYLKKCMDTKNPN